MMACNSTRESINTNNTTSDSTVYRLVKEHQILLTNYAEFKEHTSLYGASAFLINYQETVYAVTARHLVGQDGGVEPEINPNQLNDCLQEWKMFPRVEINPEKDTVIVSNQKKMDYIASDKDVLLLPLKNAGFEILPLNPAFALPVQGEKLFIVGCPYSEEDCRQNVYEVIVNAYDESTSLIIGTMREKIIIAGFSGAPLLNVKGEVVGVIRGGGEENGINYIAATFIAEIKNIK